MLTKKYWISTFIVFLVVLSLSVSIVFALVSSDQLIYTRSAGGIWTAVKWVKIRLIVRKPELHYPALLWFLSSSVADVVITIALVINLVCHLCQPENPSQLIVCSLNDGQDMWQLMMPSPRLSEVRSTVPSNDVTAD